MVQSPTKEVHVAARAHRVCNNNKYVLGNTHIKKGSNKTPMDTNQKACHGERIWTNNHTSRPRAGHSTVFLQLAQEATRELTTPWRHSSSHSHQGQGAVVRFHTTLLAQRRALWLDLDDRYNQSPDNLPEQFLPWVLQMPASQSTHFLYMLMGRRTTNDDGVYNATIHSATFMKLYLQTSSQSQLTNSQSRTMNKRLKQSGLARQPTVVNTVLPQKTILAKSSTPEV
eukprot:1219448-Amphidinium_carterae.1